MLAIACANYLTPAFGTQRLDEFTTEDVQRLELAMAHLSPKALNNTLSVFNSVLKVAEQWGVIAVVPVRGRWVKMTMPSMAFYDFDEYDRLRAAAREIGPRHELVVLLAGDAGLRCGEIRALRWSSIDFGRGLLTVERAYSLDQVLAPKSDKIRTVPMTGRLRDPLLQAQSSSPGMQPVSPSPSPVGLLTRGFLRGIQMGRHRLATTRMRWRRASVRDLKTRRDHDVRTHHYRGL